MAGHGRRVWPLEATESIPIRLSPGQYFDVLDAAAHLGVHAGYFVVAAAVKEAEAVLARRCWEKTREQANADS